VFMIQTGSKLNLEKEMSEFVLAGVAAQSLPRSAVIQ